MNGPITIPNFELRREIGHGGMATVYLAEQLQPKRNVAVKIVAPTAANDESFLRSLKREGDTAAQFSHENIVTVFACGVIDSHYYLAMEILNGGDLTEKIERGMNPDDAIDIARQMASALDHAHQRNTLHRDIKPENILFHEDGKAVLVDFGIAKAADATSEFTKLGCVVGTPHYMSPERAQGQNVDARSDIYALGVVLYEMFTSRKLYEKEDTFAVSYAHVNEPIPPLPGHLSQYQSLLNRMLAKDPADRFQSSAELVGELRRLSQRTRPVGGLGGSDPATRAVDQTVIQPVDTAITKALPDQSAAQETEIVGPPKRSERRPLWMAAIVTAVVVTATIGGYTVTRPSSKPAKLLPAQRLEINNLISASVSLANLGNFDQAIDNYAKVLEEYDCSNEEARAQLEVLDPDRYRSIVSKCD